MVREQIVSQQADNAHISLRTSRAQELFRLYHSQCFWHCSPNLLIDSGNIELVVDGLRKHGGRKGMLLAEELCR